MDGLLDALQPCGFTMPPALGQLTVPFASPPSFKVLCLPGPGGWDTALRQPPGGGSALSTLVARLAAWCPRGTLTALGAGLHSFLWLFSALSWTFIYTFYLFSVSMLPWGRLDKVLPLALLTSDASAEQGKQVVTSQERTGPSGLRRVVTLSARGEVSSRPTASWARLVLPTGAVTTGDPPRPGPHRCTPLPQTGEVSGG